MNRVQIIDIESGRKTGSVSTLKKLALALEIDLDDLVVADARFLAGGAASDVKAIR